MLNEEKTQFIRFKLFLRIMHGLKPILRLFLISDVVHWYKNVLFRLESTQIYIHEYVPYSYMLWCMSFGVTAQNTEVIRILNFDAEYYRSIKMATPAKQRKINKTKTNARPGSPRRKPSVKVSYLFNFSTLRTIVLYSLSFIFQMFRPRNIWNEFGWKKISDYS